jgi:hypothetical protein
MIRARFYANGDDYRPVEWPIKYPYWCSGYTSKNECLIIAYADNPEDITRLWPEAHDIECEEAEEIVFTSRFPKPSWYNEAER